MTPERFGPYLLLKKLAEDPLGEVFRAGRVGAGSLEQVVLLRVLNGSAIDGRSLWPAIGERAHIQEALRNPNIGSGVDVGEVQGLPYVAYDYVSGKNLGVVLDQIVKRSYPMPADHALLLGERLALGLAVAHETRTQEGRVVHGFLVPPLVMLSSEGETRILGFEAGAAIREQLAGSPALRAEFGRYLSPEAQKGAGPSPGDDIYSLGAILLELLLGHPLPSPLSDDYSPGFPHQVEQVAHHGPKGVGDVISQSLAPAGDRLGDVVSWHKALTRLMVEGGHKSTTFNLAFFMHSLFRDDIERESEELEAERGLDVRQLAATPPPSPPSAPGPAAPPTTPASAATTVGPHLATRTEHALADVDEVLAASPSPLAQADEGRRVETPLSPAPSPRTRQRRVLGPTLAVALILLGAAGKWLWDEWQERRAEPESIPAEAESIPAESQPSTPGTGELDPSLPEREEVPFSGVSVEELEAGAPVEELTPPAPDPEELMARLDRMVDERTQAVEEALRSEYDREIEALRTELAEAKERTARPPAQTSITAEPPVPMKRSESSQEASFSSLRDPPAQEIPEDRGAAAAGAPSESRAEGQPAPPPASRQAVETPPAMAGTETVAEPEPPEEVAPRVRLGEMVESGPGVVPPTGVDCPPIQYPPIAQRLGEETAVVVQVLVDENGEVRQARVPERHGFGFDDAARSNARRCTFANPPTKNGVRVRMWYAIRIVFETPD